jgi:hypothetical protein
LKSYIQTPNSCANCSSQANADARHPIPPQPSPPVTTRRSPIHRPRQARCLATRGSDLTNLHFRLAFLAPLPVNVTLRQRRASELAATCLRMRTVSDNHLAALARTSPRPAPDLTRRSSAARFSSIISDDRDSETLPRQRNQGQRLRCCTILLQATASRQRRRLLPPSPTARFSPPPPVSETLRHCRDSAPAATCLGSTRQPLRATASHSRRTRHPRHLRRAFPPPSSIIETLRHRRDSEPTPPRPACDTCSPGMSESPTLPP